MIHDATYKDSITAPFLLQRFSLTLVRFLDMPSTLRILAVIGAALVASPALALESKKVANNNLAPSHAPHQAQARDETAMQAMCREILVDTDEGYGVTNHEPRIICDELR